MSQTGPTPPPAYEPPPPYFPYPTPNQPPQYPPYPPYYSYPPYYPYAPYAPQGYAPPNYLQPYAPTIAPTNGLAVASLILSLAGFLTPLGASGLLGLILGHMALTQIKNSNGYQQGHGLALAGVIIGYSSLAFSLIVLGLYGLYMWFIFSLPL